MHDKAIKMMLGEVLIPGDLDDFIAAMQQPWSNVLRRRRQIQVDELPVASAPIPWYRLGHRPTTASPKPSRTLAYAAADFFVQDAGSLLALAAAEADTPALAGKLICDLCAAPGGKASALLEAVEAGSENETPGFLLANEVIKSRLGPLQLNLARTGSDRYAISSQDPEALADRLPGVFDLVLVDAPCSGQAMVARGKQKRSSLSINQIEHSAMRQQRILDAAVKLLRPGGRLVYSTCTFSEAENEAQIKKLLDQRRVEAIPKNALGNNQQLATYSSFESCYRLWPHLHQCAGSFAAVVQTSMCPTPRPVRRKPTNRCKIANELRAWFLEMDTSVRTWTNDSVLIGWPDDAPYWVEQVAVSGPELAHRTGQTWKPAHAAALRRVERGRANYAIELEPELARRFLGGETIPCDKDGWQVVHYVGRPLGWIKGTGGVGKNHLPISARSPGWLA